MKTCSKCREDKPSSEFFKNKAQKDGFANQCKPCHTENERWKHMRNKYGLTPDSFWALYNEQDGLCAICEVDIQPFEKRAGKHKIGCAVDHCHETGNVRGLLCNLCNMGLGLFRDTPELLTSAIKYLERS